MRGSLWIHLHPLLLRTAILHLLLLGRAILHLLLRKAVILLLLLGRSNVELLLGWGAILLLLLRDSTVELLLLLGGGSILLLGCAVLLLRHAVRSRLIGQLCASVCEHHRLANCASFHSHYCCPNNDHHPANECRHRQQTLPNDLYVCHCMHASNTSGSE